MKRLVLDKNLDVDLQKEEIKANLVKGISGIPITAVEMLDQDIIAIHNSG